MLFWLLALAKLVAFCEGAVFVRFFPFLRAFFGVDGAPVLIFDAPRERPIHGKAYQTLARVDVLLGGMRSTGCDQGKGQMMVLVMSLF